MDSNAWAVIGALGQWFAGLATLTVVWHTLSSNRPKLRVKALRGEWLREPDGGLVLETRRDRSGDVGTREVMISIVNVGHIPVSVDRIGFRNPNHYRDIRVLLSDAGIDSVSLAPQEYFQAIIPAVELQDVSVTRLDSAFVQDVSGRLHFASAGPVAWVRRAFHLRFGKGPPELHQSQSPPPAAVDASFTYRQTASSPGWAWGPRRDLEDILERKFEREVAAAGAKKERPKKKGGPL